MRKASAILACAIAALAVPATPVLAKTANASANATSAAPKADEPSAPAAACRSYVQAADGEWKPMPCQELGTEAPIQHKHAAGKADTATH